MGIRRAWKDFEGLEAFRRILEDFGGFRRVPLSLSASPSL